MPTLFATSRRALVVCSALVLMFTITTARAAEDAGMSRAEILELIDQRVEQRLRSDEFMQRRIEQGIEDYVRKQREAAANRQQQQAADLASNVRPVSTDDHIYGNPDAEITLIEYSDFECPFCKRFHGTPKRLVDGSGGRINWVYRHFPLSFHNPGAQKQAEASECAAKLGGNEAFWRYTDAIYERTSAGGNGFPIPDLVPLAVELGLPQAAFSQCLNSGEMAAEVQQDMEEGQSAGVSGTPGNILLNNRTGEAIPSAGAVPLQNLVRLADQLMR